MKRALVLAGKARGYTSPNPMVGAVIIKSKKVIAEGWHRRAGKDHAEIMALKKAGIKAKGSKLFITLEPCHHFGRTPPCVDAIIESGVREVIIAMKDPNPQTNGKSILKLKRAGINVKVGELRNDSQLLNESYIKYIKTGMPFVVAKSAQSLDGKIATALGQSKWITSKKARAYARKMRDQFDAIMVGINTILKDDPALSGSRPSKKLKKVILDSRLQISPKARLFVNTQASDCIIATTKNASQTKMKNLMRQGFSVIICPKKDGMVDLKWLLKELSTMGILNILIEGGAHVVGRALREKLVDKMHIYIAPKILGDQKALNAVVGLNPKEVKRTISLDNVTIKPLDKDFLIQGYVHGNH